MKRHRDHEEWFWICLLLFAVAVMIGLTAWPWLDATAAGLENR